MPVKHCLSILLLGLISIHSLFANAPESRTWTTAQNGPLTGILINASADSVTVKRLPDGQVFRLKLADCSAEDQAYVAKLQKDAREAESFDAKISGKIAWRLPPWNNLSWTNRQPAELWLWDEATRTPVEKLASFDVDYDSSSKRNEFIGSFVSTGPVHLWKPAKYVIKAFFQASVNGEQKRMEEISAPMLLPTATKNGVDLNTVRFSLGRN